VELSRQVKYLGVLLTSDGSDAAETLARTRQAWACFKKLRPIMTSSKITLAFKAHVMKSIIIPTALFGADTWSSAADHNRIGSAMVRMAKLACHLKPRTFDDGSFVPASTTEAMSRLTLAPIDVLIAARRLQLAGSLARNPDAVPRALAHTRAPHTRGPTTATWREALDMDLAAANMVITDARDRQTWKQRIAEFVARHTPS
jgi:hypothetical protein